MFLESKPFSKFLKLLYKDVENRIGTMIFLFEFYVIKKLRKGNQIIKEKKFCLT
jgi:hypothetical protein